MEIYKIVAVGIVSAIILVYLKSVNSELAMPAGIVAGIILLVMTASYVSEFVVFFKSLTESAGIDPSFFKLT
ncbi:MAG: hypothetical protein IJS67_04195, partial [Clostridia bacterium]|nr:hypothetical protein [Clostridia bacterium]